MFFTNFYTEYGNVDCVEQIHLKQTVMTSVIIWFSITLCKEATMNEMVNQSLGVNVDRMYQIAEINPFYQVLIEWLSKYNVDKFTFVMLPFILTILLLILLFGALFRSTKNPVTWFRKITHIAIVSVVFAISLLSLPVALQEFQTNDYRNYMTRVTNNISQALPQLTAQEKELIAYCLKDSANGDGYGFYKNHVNSGERFDKCIVRFAKHETNPTLRYEFDNQIKREEYQKLATDIAKIANNPVLNPPKPVEENQSNVGVTQTDTNTAEGSATNTTSTTSASEVAPQPVAASNPTNNPDNMAPPTVSTTDLSTDTARQNAETKAGSNIIQPASSNPEAMLYQHTSKPVTENQTGNGASTEPPVLQNIQSPANNAPNQPNTVTPTQTTSNTAALAPKQ